MAKRSFDNFKARSMIAGRCNYRTEALLIVIKSTFGTFFFTGLKPLLFENLPDGPSFVPWCCGQRKNSVG